FGIGTVVAVIHAWFVRISRVSPSSSAINGTANQSRRNHMICLDGTWNLPNVPPTLPKTKTSRPSNRSECCGQHDMCCAIRLMAWMVVGLWYRNGRGGDLRMVR